MKPGGQRAKGHAWEREVAHRLAAIFGEAKRGLSQCRGGTGEEPDVVLPDGVPFKTECKHRAAVNVLAALEQANATCNALENEWPLAICKTNRKPATATMYLNDFEALLRRWWSLEKQARHVAAAGDELATRLEQEGVPRG